MGFGITPDGPIIFIPLCIFVRPKEAAVLFKGSIPMSLQSRVQKGAKLLDEKVPDWHKKVDVKKLAMEQIAS